MSAPGRRGRRPAGPQTWSSGVATRRLSVVRHPSARATSSCVERHTCGCPEQGRVEGHAATVAGATVPHEPALHAMDVVAGGVVEGAPIHRERERVEVGAERHLEAATGVGLGHRTPEPVLVEQPLDELGPRALGERVLRGVQAIEALQDLVEATASGVRELEMREDRQTARGCSGHRGTRTRRATRRSSSSRRSRSHQSVSCAARVTTLTASARVSPGSSYRRRGRASTPRSRSCPAQGRSRLSSTQERSRASGATFTVRACPHGSRKAPTFSRALPTPSRTASKMRPGHPCGPRRRSRLRRRPLRQRLRHTTPATRIRPRPVSSVWMRTPTLKRSPATRSTTWSGIHSAVARPPVPS